MEHSLKRRIRYFLSSAYRGRTEIHSTLEKMQSFGPIVVIGGILRDLLLSNNQEFKSDLDLVIDPLDPDMFRDYVASFGASKNRFGGFSLVGQQWKIDIWLLKDTWAHQAGHVNISNFSDLLDTTFFNCDAIIYDLSCGQVITKPAYFDELSRRWLEINLQPNPNPIGNTVRAFRYAMRKNFTWGPRLSKYVEEVLEHTDWQSLVKYELASYHNSTIGYFPKEQFRESLKRFLANNQKGEFVPIKKCKWEQVALKF